MEPPPPAKRRHPEEYLDPVYWNPKCGNFEVIDWNKFLAKNPSPPKVFDSPQGKTSFGGCLFAPLWWWNRSWFCKPFPTVLCCGKPKPNTARISDEGGELINQLLGANPNSSSIPIALRNKLLWTENNVAPETLLSFNRWAWRSQSDEGRVVALGTFLYDWTNDPTCFGCVFSIAQKNIFANVQVSPDEKWILLSTFSDPTKIEGEVNYLYIYVVQEGDVFKTPDGKVLDHVKPGDLVRLTWGDGSDPYICDNDNLKYMYFPRAVATFDENNGVVVKNDEHYGDLLARATNESDKCCETCCYTCACCLSQKDRFDLQVNNISDLQTFASAPVPPTMDAIDRL